MLRISLACLILAGSLMAGDRRDDQELDDDLWFIWQQQKHEAAERERERDCEKCLQRQLSENVSLNTALLMCQDFCD